MPRPAQLEALLGRFFPPERLARTHGYRVELEALVNDELAPNPLITIELNDIRGADASEWELIAVVESAKALLQGAAPGARILQDGRFGAHQHLTDDERTLGSRGWR